MLPITKKLSTLPLFSDVPLFDLNWFVHHCTVLQFHKGDLLMSQGELASTAMFLLEGQLDVLLFSDNKIHRLGQVYPGEVFGEQGLFVCNATRNAQVSARTDGFCLQLDRSFMHQETQNAAVLTMEKLILATLARRIRSANLNLQKLNLTIIPPTTPEKRSLFSQFQHWIGRTNESRTVSTNRSKFTAKTQC